MRQSLLEESMKHKEILKEKEENIAQLQISLSEAVTQVKNRDLEVKHLSNYIGKCKILLVKRVIVCCLLATLQSQNSAGHDIH